MRLGHTLWVLIIAIRRREAYNPVDMIFGLLVLVPVGIIKQVKISVPSPIVDVYVEFGKYYIRKEVDECLLNHTSSLAKLPGLPSWCPNFSSPKKHSPSAASGLTMSTYPSRLDPKCTAPASTNG